MPLIFWHDQYDKIPCLVDISDCWHKNVDTETWYDVEMSRLMSKPTKWHVRPAKTQISLGIRPVWSESSLSAWRKLGSLATHWAHSEDSDQTGRMPRLIWVFAGRTAPSDVTTYSISGELINKYCKSRLLLCLLNHYYSRTQIAVSAQTKAGGDIFCYSCFDSIFGYM